jgi:transposase-like protein
MRETTLSREELYKQLWTTPILRLSRRYGVPYMELVRICEEHTIPRPPQGYWSKVHAGRRFERIPLPETQAQPLVTILYKPSKKKEPLASTNRTSKECTACRALKPFNEFYKKGSRFDSRCKICIRKLKVEVHRKTQGIRSDQELMELGERRRILEGYPRVEHMDGKVVIVDRIYFPLLRHSVKSEHILELYHENLSVADIAKSVGRSPKTVTQALNKFGIEIGRRELGRRLSSDVPYGWKVREARLVPHVGEQWILEKIEGDLNRNKGADQIVRNLNSAGIRLRYGRSWSSDSIESVLKKNRKLTPILCKSSRLSGDTNPPPEDRQ